VLLVVMAAVLVLAGCSGVPRSSPPQVISSVQVPSASPQPTITPDPGDSQQEIVRKFLIANASSDSRHSAARSFLTPTEQRQWIDTPVNVVDNTCCAYLSAATTVSLTTNLVGAIGSASDPDGTYTAKLGQKEKYDFELQRIAGQWRISSAPSGVIVDESTIGSIYFQRKVYFLNPTQTRVVPDIRYSVLSDPLALASWLLDQLAAGPPEDWQNAVLTQVPPEQPSDPHHAAVSNIGGFVRVNLPRASAQQDPAARTAMAEQVALTLDQAYTGHTFVITDGQRQVTIPGHPNGFTAADFHSDATGTAPLFFVNAGQVVTEQGNTVPGVLSRWPRNVSAVALESRGSANYQVAVSYGASDGQRLRLDVGRLNDSALHPWDVPAGPLSRPAWAPGTQQPEVWVSSSSGVFRVDGTTGVSSPVPLNESTAGTLPGQVVALQFSPDGTRIALVVTAPATSSSGPTSELWVGAVVRSGTQPSVNGLKQITPPSVHVTDVAWNDATTLYVVGTDPTPGEWIWDVQSDGSSWNKRDANGLPSAPTSITIAPDTFPVVSASGRIWQQQRTWQALPASGGAASNATYLQ
jgi:hypothetical protein